MSSGPLYFVRPESGIYHTRRDCPLLHNPYRYWNIDSVPTVDDLPPSNSYRNHGHPRRVCKSCAKWDASLAIPGVESVR